MGKSTRQVDGEGAKCDTKQLIEPAENPANASEILRIARMSKRARLDFLCDKRYLLWAQLIFTESNICVKQKKLLH